MSETKPVTVAVTIRFVNTAEPLESEVAVVVPDNVAVPALIEAVTTTPAPPRFPTTGRDAPENAAPLVIEPGWVLTVNAGSEVPPVSDGVNSEELLE